MVTMTFGLKKLQLSVTFSAMCVCRVGNSDIVCLAVAAPSFDPEKMETHEDNETDRVSKVMYW